ncbi:MAG: PAS domain S-box protein [Syntrophobacteraceae bacterium]|nr:PAS domain S-box protein [Syntrophobacteraceae bacterium]
MSGVSSDREDHAVLKRASPDATGAKPGQDSAFPKRPAGLVKLCKRLKREVRDRKKAQLELRKSELHFRRLVETMNSGLAIQDEHGVITYVNDKLLEISGYGKQDFVGRPIEHILDMIGTTNRRQVLEEIEKRKRGEADSYELTGRRKDGGQLSVIVAPRPLLDEKGVFRGSFAVVTDITELKEAEERLRTYGEQLQFLSSQLLAAQEREKKRMSMELHDDLGQSLVALKLCAKSIRMRLAPDQETELCGECLWLVKLADEIVQRFRELCGDLCPLIIEDLGFSSAVRMLFEDFSRIHGTRCDTDVDDLDKLLDTEAQIMIYRVLQECLNNVAQHAAASRVSFEFKRDNKTAFFRIQDDGIGFPEDYCRTGSLQTKSLGLITMAERVRMLGGNLDIKSAEGSTSISFSVPLQA